GHALITATNFLTIVIAFGFFSFEEVKILQFPLIHTLEYIEMPFINRVENLVFPFFLFSNLVTTVMFAFAARSALGRMLPRVDAKGFALPLTAA
ncbi:GerAB/ArcD/ProY family transporter, partial [Marinobacter sp. 71-i]